MTATPNHALQRTGSAVTAPAALHHRLYTHRQVPRPLRLSLIQHFVTCGSPIDKINYFFAALRSMSRSYESLIEGLRAVPAIFESGMAILSRDAFLRLLLALQNHRRITFGKATRATISSAASP